MGGVPQKSGLRRALDLRSSSSLSPRDRRYGTARWQRIRLRVLDRDMWTCRLVAACPERASVADHIIPSYPAMPDELFFGIGNLRAACRKHNLARGFAASVSNELRVQPSSVVTRDYSKADDGAA